MRWAAAATASQQPARRCVRRSKSISRATSSSQPPRRDERTEGGKPEREGNGQIHRQTGRKGGRPAGWLCVVRGRPRFQYAQIFIASFVVTVMSWLAIFYDFRRYIRPFLIFFSRILFLLRTSVFEVISGKKIGWTRRHFVFESRTGGKMTRECSIMVGSQLLLCCKPQLLLLQIGQPSYRFSIIHFRLSIIIFINVIRRRRDCRKNRSEWAPFFFSPSKHGERYLPSDATKRVSGQLSTPMRLKKSLSL